MDIKDLDFNLLKALDALLAEPSVSGAAQRLGLSQPATSAALARLRHVLSDPLLVRRGNTMVHTARADELKPRVSALLDEIARTFAPLDAFDPATSTRHFRILDVGMPEEHPDYDLWVSADEHYTLLRASVTGYMQTAYELSSYHVQEH